MTVLLDTNIVLDIIEVREPFFQDSYAVVNLAAEGKLKCLLSASAVTDVYYIVRKNTGSQKEALNAILKLKALVDLCDTTVQDIDTAVTLHLSDFEDAVAASAAQRENAAYIITRNCEDFTGSPVPAITPADFLSQMGFVPA
jgi:predicted nucleic acid-binding protein